MPELVFTDGKLYVDGDDLSGDLNEIRAGVQAPALPAPKFGLTWEQFAPGVKRGSISIAGCWRAALTGSPDGVLFANLAVAGKVLSAWPQGVDGEIGLAFQSVQGRYDPLAGRHGEVLPFSADFATSGAPVIHPTLLHPPTPRSASGNGVARQLGQAAATQKLYGFLQVLASSGTTPTLDVLIQSDDAEGFGSPTTRITFPQQTAKGAVWAAPIAGPITDDWYRVSYTIGGAGPSFTFIVGAAIVTVP